MDDEDFRPTTQVSSVCFYEEKIKTNTTYYYVLRFLNEHRIPGETSPVIAARLVDDGGYKYLQAESMTVSELDEGSLYENPSIVCKKIFQILPNINQIQLDTQNADFTKEAHTQMQNVHIGTNEDRLWDKSFKIRLTSKKTGKKVDLNVTFNIKELAKTVSLPTIPVTFNTSAPFSLSSGGT